MNIEIIKGKLKYSVEHHEVEVEINNKKLIIDVNVSDNIVQDHIESRKTDLWNTLTYEEKMAINNELDKYFG